jgi:hypothetical protein
MRGLSNFRCLGEMGVWLFAKGRVCPWSYKATKDIVVSKFVEMKIFQLKIILVLVQYVLNCNTNKHVSCFICCHSVLF